MEIKFAFHTTQFSCVDIRCGPREATAAPGPRADATHPATVAVIAALRRRRRVADEAANSNASRRSAATLDDLADALLLLSMFTSRLIWRPSQPTIFIWSNSFDRMRFLSVKPNSIRKHIWNRKIFYWRNWRITVGCL